MFMTNILQDDVKKKKNQVNKSLSFAHVCECDKIIKPEMTLTNNV